MTGAEGWKLIYQSLADNVGYEFYDAVESLAEARVAIERAAHVRALRWAAERYGKISAAIGEQISVDAREVELRMKTIEDPE